MSDIYRDSIFWVEVERIKPNPFQPRREFNQEKLNGLAESIRMYGLLQPLTVTRDEKTREDGGIIAEYELIAGERRLRASKIAGLTQVPVIIRSAEDTDQMKLELAIIENLQREDLNPVDRAKAFMRLHKEFNFTHANIGKKVGKSREYVSNTLRLLMLPENVLGYLAEGRIAEGHTRPLLMLNDKPQEQEVLVKEILLKKLTVRESEMLARRAAQDKVTAKHKINPEILHLEKKLTEKLGTRVQIEQRETGGKVVISFFSADDLSELLKTIQLSEQDQKVSDVFNGNDKATKDDLVEGIQQQSENKSSETEPNQEHTEQVETTPSQAEDEPKTARDETTELEDEKTDTPEHGETSMADRFKEFITGHASEKESDSREETSNTEALQSQSEDDAQTVEPHVTPSPERPMPETQETVTKEERSATDAPEEKTPTSETVEEEELYSIRNFSI
jgi:ParB family chromosome partitioning protein